MIMGLIAFILILLVATFPATWLFMLFLGNVGVHVGYWGVLPIGILISALIGSAGTQWDRQPL